MSAVGVFECWNLGFPGEEILGRKRTGMIAGCVGCHSWHEVQTDVTERCDRLVGSRVKSGLIVKGCVKRDVYVEE